MTDPLRYGKTFTLAHDPVGLARGGRPPAARTPVPKVLFHTTVVDAVDRQTADVDGAVPRGPSRRRVAITAQHRRRRERRRRMSPQLAGFETFVGPRRQAVQNPTMIFRLMGVDVARLRRALRSDDTILGDERLADDP